ncbi:MAG: hypothetical protein GXP08_03710 [Gammaproteobacteria bacterium]|nr:hypothetical protein [Gammaproteobacteria bacterium]
MTIIINKLKNIPSAESIGLVNRVVMLATAGVALLVLMTLAMPLLADDKMQLEISVIKGNRELPKVLYIMPWKRLSNDSVEQKLTLHSLFEDAFDPIEPESFQQHIDNYQYFVQP